MAFAELLNEEARELAAIGVDVIQFDEPAFNVYMDAVTEWGIAALERAAAGPRLQDRRPYLLWLRHQGEYRLEGRPRRRMAAIRAIFPALAASHIDQVSVECAGSKVPTELLGLLAGKEILLGAIDVAREPVETAEEVAATIERALRFVPMERLFPCTNCGMAPMRRATAVGKLRALAAGAALVRGRLG